eukprot:gene4572-6769_t
MASAVELKEHLLHGDHDDNLETSYQEDQPTIKQPITKSYMIVDDPKKFRNCPGRSSIFGTDCEGNSPIHFERLKSPSAHVNATVAVFCIIWFSFLLLRLRRLRGLRQMKGFFEEVLEVSNAELQTISLTIDAQFHFKHERGQWSDLETKLIQAHEQRKFGFTKYVDKMDSWIVKSVIMRKANGFVRLYSNVISDVLVLPSITCSSDARTPYLPRILHHVLSALIDSTVFKQEDGVDCLRDEISWEGAHQPAKHLRVWMRVIGIVMLIFSPFILLYNAADFCFRYSDLLKNSPGAFTNRQWTHYATWYFRCDNELDHYCKRRLHDAYKPTKSFLDSFASHTLATISRFLQFLAGGILAVLFFLALYYDESFLQLDLLGDRSVAWVMTILVVLMGLLRGYASESIEVQSPRQLWEDVKRALILVKPEWEKCPTHPRTYSAIQSLFDQWAFVVFGELFGILLAPLLLIFFLPSRSNEIIQFYRENFIKVKGFGHHEKHIVGRSRLMLDLVQRSTQHPPEPLEGTRAHEMLGSQMMPLNAEIMETIHFDENPVDDRSYRSHNHLEVIRQEESSLYVLPTPP